MMMGATKKKMIATGVVSFMVPVIIGGSLFLVHNKKQKEEIEALKVQAATVKKYVLNKSLAEGDIITPEDLIAVDVKAESAPSDSYDGIAASLSKITNRRLIIDAEAKTIVTNSMLFAEAEDEPTLDARLQEFNMITLPSDLDVGDYIDIRITFPNGEDYLVVSGKEIKSLGKTSDSNTIFVELDEEEIIRTTAAIIESYMTNGSEVYANKYVKPNTQLYDSERVDYVAKYKDAVKALIAERDLVANGISGDSGDSGDIEEYKRIYNVENPVISGDKIIITEADITVEEIINKTGIDKKYVEEIRKAIEENNEATLAVYKSWLVKEKLSMKNNYPVKANIANLVLSNPNILKEVESKYNILALEAQRVNIVELPLYSFETDDYTGKVTITEEETIGKIEEELTKKIENQKLERKEYLQALILEQTKKN